jgi:hypothetical protein
MTKEEFTKLLKEKEKGCGLVTVTIPMKELRKIDEEEWVKWYYSIYDNTNKETLAKFEEKGEVRYTFNLNIGTIIGCAWLCDDIVGIDKEIYWDDEDEDDLNYWASLLKRV